MRVIPPELRATLDDDDVAEIEANPVELSGDTQEDAIGLALAWANSVQKIDLDRSLPWSDRSVWNEHDLAGSLFLRDFLQEAIGRLRPSTRAKIERHVAEADERFRSCTVDDPRKRMAEIADVDLTGRPWWWLRIPDSGPIAEDLSKY